MAYTEKMRVRFLRERVKILCFVFLIVHVVIRFIPLIHSEMQDGPESQS